MGVQLYSCSMAVPNRSTFHLRNNFINAAHRAQHFIKINKFYSGFNFLYLSLLSVERWHVRRHAMPLFWPWMFFIVNSVYSVVASHNTFRFEWAESKTFNCWNGKRWMIDDVPMLMHGCLRDEQMNIERTYWLPINIRYANELFLWHEKPFFVGINNNSRPLIKYFNSLLLFNVQCAIVRRPPQNQ